jgi:hypothetical protein
MQRPTATAQRLPAPVDFDLAAESLTAHAVATGSTPDRDLDRFTV